MTVKCASTLVGSCTGIKGVPVGSHSSVFAPSLPVLAQLLSFAYETGGLQAGKSHSTHQPVRLLSQCFTQQLLSTAISPFSHSQAASSSPISVTAGTGILLFTAKPQDHKQMTSKSREVIPCQKIPSLCVLFLPCSQNIWQWPLQETTHLIRWICDLAFPTMFSHCVRKHLTGLHRLQHYSLYCSRDMILELQQMGEQRLPKHPDRPVFKRKHSKLILYTGWLQRLGRTKNFIHTSETLSGGSKPYWKILFVLDIYNLLMFTFIHIYHFHVLKETNLLRLTRKLKNYTQWHAKRLKPSMIP